ncbi:hypothetical protein EVAR_76456_1 [Eumeta japonica]|uniref:Uncharacterized protein n=1 Tax=Eumeta variegata TaxID=151549 RepID=A0A4C1T935_EUMVA|nr:hypothetical protein EVAR_76456_1 [Eumeta japonica]
MAASEHRHRHSPLYLTSHSDVFLHFLFGCHEGSQTLCAHAQKMFTQLSPSRSCLAVQSLSFGVKRHISVGYRSAAAGLTLRPFTCRRPAGPRRSLVSDHARALSDLGLGAAGAIHAPVRCRLNCPTVSISYEKRSPHAFQFLCKC